MNKITHYEKDSKGFMVYSVQGKESPSDRFIKILGSNLPGCEYWNNEWRGYHAPTERQLLDLIDDYDGEPWLDIYIQVKGENEDTIKRENKKDYWLGKQYFLNMIEDYRNGMSREELEDTYKLDGKLL
tara:strand:+ start:46 stop:429 length:384 start_codon:yes stop_codon:yes gene_type:complete